MTVDVDVAGGGESHLERDDARNHDMDADADHEVDDVNDSKPKKKRKVIKTADKKYECPHPECGKSYSRAEHLYRHQLNRMSDNARASPLNL